MVTDYFYTYAMNGFMIVDNVAIAFLITLAAGLATVLGSALVFFKKRPARASWLLVWRFRLGRWSLFL
ncbi:hypothetical protein AO385_0042 [Moraxella catarrhalis]|uniref:Uncharacterized protein n=1 Tax=Moraxella catarrhalis TaxID=480 RepID=A0A198UJ20_MORCA|nr:hypothetical protein AO384_0977 [Moraxella catarrhalis]OAU97261.1 hypothetical protein AO383_1142 [Moraxella catarrhalis]OAV04625.1 hypothetical protein AO385_0042 [Moraxella catarrhalis]